MSAAPEAAAALALLALAAGCGGRPAPVPLEEYSAEAGDAICDWAVRCLHVPDRPTCERMQDPKDLDTRRAEDAVAAGRLAYNARAAGACIQAIREAHCLVLPFSDDACDRMFRGLLSEGDACTSDFECADGADCEELTCAGQCCLGSCGPPSPAQQPAPRAKIGERCQTHTDCVQEAYCETDGVCTEVPAEEGARCLFGCARGDLYCDTDVLECRRYAGAGEECDPTGASAPPCDPAWSYCDGVCSPLPGPGEPCEPDQRRCIPTAFCDGGTCRERGAAGEPCDSHDQCQVACVDGACAAYETCGT